MEDNDLPITDWSHVGRQKYVDKNRQIIELVIEQALENFDEKTISLAFQSQAYAVSKIIDLFLLSYFSVDELPNGIPKDIKLFSQLPFWVNYKTAGNVYVGDSSHKQALSNSVHEQSESKVESVDTNVQKLAKNLKKLNQHVAPDLISYWLLANKKLLRELSSLECDLVEIENEVSSPQKTRYKVDASFRYLYLFLNVAKHLDSVEFYENKYFVKGLNRPQYVAGHSETHQTKHQVRQTIKHIISRLYEIFAETDDKDSITRALFKAIAKTAVLDVYEINKNDTYRLDYEQKLRKLKSKPSTLLEQIS
ncbi:hypothetical protein [Photobacterium kishitanii]|uniref:hypothetical protein n=1 Tax=Photobacterium kishitanii TaxID=318456 RepID=UPI0004361F02|nr:hypothetical protein [Photobacterium kishitanii]CEO41330.1 conserved hypothetical protein [Photobacterium kishitanii]